jgi:hypothetical protein
MRRSNSPHFPSHFCYSYLYSLNVFMLYGCEREKKMYDINPYAFPPNRYSQHPGKKPRLPLWIFIALGTILLCGVASHAALIEQQTDITITPTTMTPIQLTAIFQSHQQKSHARPIAFPTTPSQPVQQPHLAAP